MKKYVLVPYERYQRMVDKTKTDNDEKTIKKDNDSNLKNEQVLNCSAEKNDNNLDMTEQKLESDVNQAQTGEGNKKKELKLPPPGYPAKSGKVVKVYKKKKSEIPVKEIKNQTDTRNVVWKDIWKRLK